MNRLIWSLGALTLTGAGVAGRWMDASALAHHASWFLVLGPLLLALAALRSTYYRSGTHWPRSSGEPEPLRLTWLDYLKVPVCWFDDRGAISPTRSPSWRSFCCAAPSGVTWRWP